jgi:coenzyme F420-reducing hydrogenase alpha subunit
MTTRTINVDYIARIEGESALNLQIKNGQVTSAQLRIFEAPRLFEALLRGRDYTEAPDITARICGICPVAYQMSAVHAMESALGIKVTGQLRELRRLLYCGEWIESHALHIVMLHAPDFLGFPDGIQMAAAHADMVTGGLAIKKAGNHLLRLLGGREIHPVNVKVGGFYRLPTIREFAPVAEELKTARDLAVKLLHWVATFTFPDFQRDYEFVALRHDSEYPINEGRIVSSRGLNIAVADFDTQFEERHVSHSTSLQAVIKQRGSYLVGPMARYNLNFDRLPAEIQTLAHAAGLGATCRNPFQSIIIRALELVYACDEALRIIAAYEPPEQAAVPLTPHAGIGHAATEAPRGILYHRYEIAADGSILHANIVPPTSQNQLCIEEDLCDVANASLALPDEGLRDLLEQTIRNYDPCISCSCHFLKLSVQRE